LYAALSGSGSALFGLYRTTEDADAAEGRLRLAGVRTLRTRTLPRAAYWDSMVER
jgi:4-diphosphocytidyl-2-C-methyl-D-erythritol kinase